MPWRGRVIPYADPLHLGRHPFQTFMLAVVFISGLPLLLGHPTAGSLEDSLPTWEVVMWGAALLIGSATALVGSYWRGLYANGLTIETIGLIVIGAPALAYALVLIVHFGLTGATATGIILAFGAACWKRAYDNYRVLRRATGGLPRRVVAREGETEAEAWARLKNGDL